MLFVPGGLSHHFTGLLPHGTPTNGSNDQRFALQYHFVAKGTEKLSNDQLRLSRFGGDGAGAEC
jgi:phytanoyl-CoA hydroxylase